MYKKILFIFLTISSFSSFAITATQIEYDVSLFSRKLPSRVDGVTTLKSVLFVNSMFYKGVIYTMQVNTDAISLKQIEQKMNIELKTSMCRGSWPREVLDSGFAIDHNYQDQTGKTIIMNRLTIKDCR